MSPSIKILSRRGLGTYWEDQALWRVVDAKESDKRIVHRSVGCYHMKTCGFAKRREAPRAESVDQTSTQNAKRG